MINMKKIILISILSLSYFSEAQEQPMTELDSLKMEVKALKEMMTTKKEEEKTKSEKWYDKISFGGYVQIRYNELFETNPNLECEQCDRFWGDDNNGLSFRRIRVKFSGQITPRIYFSIQPDFAQSVDGKNLVGTIKDMYFDIGLNSKNEYKLRIGQGKVPYGYGNLQSSGDRLSLDRDDAMNSGLKDERDLGIYLIWTGEKQQKLMKELKDLKHAGDFGIFTVGFYNGQTGNSFDANKKFHWVVRASYPFRAGNQVIEPSIQAYTGKFVLPNVSSGVVSHQEYLDQRAAVSFVLYPKPFGIQTEYNIGKGPEYDASTNSIKTKNLHGGYATFSYFFKKWNQTFIPFARIQHYKGGKKHELDARSYNVKEYEAGVEWHPFKAFELVAMYTYSNRMFRDFSTPNYHEKGGLIRLQAQLKF